jgi:prepilin-type N-terminal cleavage/methylation domain-containing protein
MMNTSARHPVLPNAPRREERGSATRSKPRPSAHLRKFRSPLDFRTLLRVTDPRSDAWCASSSRAPASAFTLIEIMVTVALLSVIILGLVAMFNQTRRAFMSSLAQVDVLESGRAAADIISRDLEQLAPADYANVTNFYVGTAIKTYGLNSGLLIEQLANPADTWTNIAQELFFLTPAPPNNGQWNAIGYRLQTADEENSIGSLYRYYAPGLTITNQNSNLNLSNQLFYFVNATTPLATTTNFNRIIDGVTYFRVLAYKPGGILITNGATAGAITTYPGITIGPGLYPGPPGQDFTYNFYSNATPAYVEIELGILETQALERYRSLLVPGQGPQPAATAYLTNNPGFVHIFRQRIPIRDVDPTTAFP